MGKGKFPIERFQKIQTPFYYYDSEVLRRTLRTINEEAGKHEGFVVHYAIKANANPKILRIIREAGLGADCVSGGEIEASIKAGFPASKIVYAGVGKSDWEINLGLDSDIFCFNVESIPELEVINELAAKKGKVARVAFRLNPNVGAHTHANITTGLAENKFGIAMRDMLKVIDEASKMANVKFVGLHFHIGSQILDMGDFQALCNRVNELQDELERHRIRVEHINVGGGLGVDYEHPNRLPIPDFKAYFDTYARQIKLRNNQTLHFELGRAVVAQCGSLITRTIYIKEGATNPPTRYNSGSMILAMENAGKLIEDEELREQIKGAGIGTSATRAEIIKKLEKIKYIEINSKTQIILPTKKGEKIYDIINNAMPDMLNPKLTASWEKGLEMVAKKEIEADEFMSKLEKYIHSKVDKLVIKM